MASGSNFGLTLVIHAGNWIPFAAADGRLLTESWRADEASENWNVAARRDAV